MEAKKYNGSFIITTPQSQNEYPFAYCGSVDIVT